MTRKCRGKRKRKGGEARKDEGTEGKEEKEGKVGRDEGRVKTEKMG